MVGRFQNLTGRWQLPEDNFYRQLSILSGRRSGPGTCPVNGCKTPGQRIPGRTASACDRATVPEPRNAVQNPAGGVGSRATCKAIARGDSLASGGTRADPQPTAPQIMHRLRECRPWRKPRPRIAAASQAHAHHRPAHSPSASSSPADPRPGPVVSAPQGMAWPSLVTIREERPAVIIPDTDFVPCMFPWTR